jgi:hypothetical protein
LQAEAVVVAEQIIVHLEMDNQEEEEEAAGFSALMVAKRLQVLLTQVEEVVELMDTTQTLLQTVEHQHLVDQE